MKTKENKIKIVNQFVQSMRTSMPDNKDERGKFIDDILEAIHDTVDENITTWLLESTEDGFDDPDDDPDDDL